MTFRYVRFDGQRVSPRWNVVLKAARAAGVRFTVNSGHRTLSEQLVLFRANMVRPGVPKPGHPLTAVPTPSAPHIRLGRQAHAIDVDSLDGGETRLQRWLEKQGAHPTNPVPGESWHMELAEADLKRLAARLEHKPLRALAAGRAVSTTCVNLVARFEGFRGFAYNDAAGNATVGFGHLLHLGRVTDEDARVFGTKDKPKLTVEQGRTLLRHDLRTAADVVRKLVTVPVTRNEFAALVSLVFNIGGGNFAGSTVLRELNKGHRVRAGAAFLLFNKAGGKTLLGLSRRRRAERRLFRKDS